jgi:hypothetical protein
MLLVKASYETLTCDGLRKGYTNPFSIFVNIGDITRVLAKHAAKLQPKPKSNAIGSAAWMSIASRKHNLVASGRYS